MKRSLMRPTAALFPAVLLAAGLAGNSDIISSLFFYWCMIQLCSLCSVDAFRNAAAREPGVKRVDRRFSGTWIMILLGMALTGAFCWFTGGWEARVEDALALAISAGCITIEQMFEERMFALSRRTDGVVLGIIANALLLVGLLLDASGGVAAPVDVQFFFTACGTALGMLISIIASYVIEPMHAFSLVPRNIAFFPKAAVQCLLYPAAMMAQSFNAAGFAGLILWRLSRTVCRRASDESRPLNLLLVFVCAVLSIAGLWSSHMLICAYGAAMAMVCALVVFCAPGWRIYTGAVLMIAADIMLVCPLPQESLNMAAVCAACVAAVVLNLHKAFLRKV